MVDFPLLKRRTYQKLASMADELFENNVASEMSLEEAIERGILPAATYVSALYGYNQELDSMQEQINKIKDGKDKKEAQELLNVLREKLDKDTGNLSDLFSTYMQNPNGKYIIFCRNIEDMNEKIKQAHEMFERVNPNITVRAVSSTIKESDRILTEFEQDTDEGTLKLLYAVNMINEGYHIKDLDGVIMMRPTFSPTIYTQQLGRALTVGRDKKPVVLDLVNNFDSCKIIEDFAERMRQYKGRDGLGRTEGTKKSKISIFDNTKEFREIAKKITELSSTKEVNIASESETNVLIKKYDLDEETISIIKKIYGSIDEFRKIYIEAVINRNVDEVIKGKKIKNANLIRRFDLSSPDWAQRNSGIVDLIYDSYSDKAFIKSEDLEKELLRWIEQGKNIFTEKRKKVLFMLYGVNGEKMSQAAVAKALNVGSDNIRQYNNMFRAIMRRRAPHIKELDLENRILDIDHDLQKKIIEEYFKNFDIFVPREPTSMDEDVKIKLTNMLSKGIEKTKKRNEQVDIIKRMSKEQKLDILKARFGEGIRSSNISVVSPGHRVYEKFERADGVVDINEKLLDGNYGNYCDIFFKECLDSEYAQSKIVEFMVNSFSNSELSEAGRKEEIDDLITNNGFFIEERKSELKELLDERTRVAVKETILNEMEVWKSSTQLETLKKMTINKLDLSVYSYNCLSRAKINTVQDLMEKTEEDLIKVSNLGKNSREEVIYKMKTLGIEMVDGQFVSQNSHNTVSDADAKKTKELEEKISSSDVLGEEKKKELRKLLYETFNATIADNPEPSEEKSKEELLKNILEQQRIIAEQRKEIDELSSQKKEETDE